MNSGPRVAALPNIAARMRAAEAQSARGNYLRAFDIVAALVKAGVTDASVFDAYRRLHNLTQKRDIPHSQVFDFIYATNAWEGGSGPGSFPHATETYRAFLKDFMATHAIHSVVDVGCGDWQSSRLIDWSGVDYLGLDVSAVVLNNTKRFAKAGVRFIEGDARTVDLPEADLLIIKDVLQHWSNADIMAIIPKFRRFRWCLVTNGATEEVRADVNKDIPAGSYRSIDLSKPPFSVPGSYPLSYDISYVTRRGQNHSKMKVFLIDRDEVPQVRPERTTAPPVFAHEYDLNALHLLTPRGRDFQMYVTPRYRDHYETRSYEQFSASLVASIVRRAELFVDIGSSYGFYSLLAASVHPNLDIIAVEPTPATCTVLKRNVDLLGTSKVAVHELAVSDSVGHRQFNVTFASDSCGFFDHPNVGRLQSIDVKTTTVDALLTDRASCPLIIKIDTEGNELAVLRGMTETLKRFSDIRLLVEFCPATLRAAGVEPRALLELLKALGFQTFILDERRRRFYRATPEIDNLIQTQSDYANLYCVRSTRALNVCFFSHLSGLGGAERVLLELVDDLVVNHDAVCSVVMPSAGLLTAAVTKIGAAPIVIPYSWWCATAGIQPTPEQKTQAIRKSVESIMRDAAPDIRLLDPDVVWSQTMVIPWGAMMAASLGKPHVWYVTEFGERDHGFKFFSPLEQTLREITTSSEVVYTCSKAVAKELFPDADEKRVRTLYCDVRIPEAAKKLSGSEKQYYSVPGAVKLGIFATVLPSKGQEDIVLAVAELTRRGYNLELLLAGAPQATDYRRDLDEVIAREGLAERVRFAGHLADPYPAMQATDIVVICSRNEAFGRTGVEAMLLGKPTIFPNTGGVLEYCVDGQTGLSYPPGDVPALVDRLEQLVGKPSQWEVMGSKGRAHASTLFGADNFSVEVSRTLLNLRAQGKASGMPATIASQMQYVTAPGLRDQAKIGRNERCPCGSGKKYKHCHGKNA